MGIGADDAHRAPDFGAVDVGGIGRDASGVVRVAAAAKFFFFRFFFFEEFEFFFFEFRRFFGFAFFACGLPGRFPFFAFDLGFQPTAEATDICFRVDQASLDATDGVTHPLHLRLGRPLSGEGAGRPLSGRRGFAFRLLQASGARTALERLRVLAKLRRDRG